MTEFEVGHIRVARRDAPFQRAREFVEINTAAQRAKWRRSPMSTPTPWAHGVTACTKFRDQPLSLTDGILCLRRAANGKKSDRRKHRRQYFHRAYPIRGSGAPEGIRTSDPQIRSLILSHSLTFLNFP